MLQNYKSMIIEPEQIYHENGYIYVPSKLRVEHVNIIPVSIPSYNKLYNKDQERRKYIYFTTIMITHIERRQTSPKLNLSDALFQYMYSGLQLWFDTALVGICLKTVFSTIMGKAGVYDYFLLINDQTEFFYTPDSVY